ncbi:MAG: tetratricopeptide repeat protein [Thermodesulfobacteriota bacterium]
MSQEQIESSPPPPRLALPAAALVFFVILAFAGSLTGAFVFDDEPDILQNPYVRKPQFSLTLLRDMAYSAALNNRPLVNMSLAANYAAGGFNPLTYHVVNLGIHALAGLFLFFSLSLLFRRPAFEERFARHGTALAFFIALLWALHPLQTESVTYVIQRCESLMGLFFLAAVFCALKGWSSRGPHIWHILAILCFFLGAGAKEIIAVCPPVILVMDMVANRKTVLRALKGSWLMYSGFAAGLCVQAWWIVSAGNPLAMARSLHYTRWEYLGTQPAVILHYLRLCFWPDHLFLDYYGWPLSGPFTTIWTSALVLAALALTAICVWRKMPAGIAGAWFFLILFPSSSIVPLNNLAAEHRMYLPLAAVIALAVCLGFVLLSRLSRRMPEGRQGLPFMLGAVACLLCAAGLGVRTHVRNQDYATESGMWRTIVEAHPAQPRARVNFCSALRKEGRADEAVVQCEEALRQKPGFSTALLNLGAIRAGRGQYKEALEYFLAAYRSDPMDAMIVNNIGASFLYLNQPGQSVQFFQQALVIKPFHDIAAANLAFAYLLLGKDAESQAMAQRALGVNPQNSRALTVLGVLAVKQGRGAEAEAYLVRALSLDPGDETAKSYLDYLRNRGRALR